MRTTCPECGHQQTMDDNQVGASVTCEECRHRFQAEASVGIQEGLPPTKARTGVEDDREPRRRDRHEQPTGASAGTTIALVLGGLLMLFFLLCGVGAVGGFFFSFRAAQELDVVAAEIAALEEHKPMAGMPDMAERIQQPIIPPDPNALPAANAQERIRNGDFEQGHKGFRTQYDYSPLNLRAELAYDILSNPPDAHADAAKFGDHTTGKGKMLMVNGGHAIEKLVWGQTTEVQPVAKYTFSLWVASWTVFAPAQIDVRINGKSIGQITAPQQPGAWKELRVDWNAGAAKSAAIEVYDLNQAFSGNDFALDDISLRGPAPK